MSPKRNHKLTAMPTLFSPINSDPLAEISPPPTPLQVFSGECNRKLRYDDREMQIIPVDRITSFKLPEGWAVEVIPRGPNSSVKLSDKYYYEPGTGRKFRSLASIKRYLNGEAEILPREMQSKCLVPYQNCGSLRRVVYDGKLWTPAELEEARYTELNEIVPTTLQPKSSPLLPDGWVVEEIARRCGSRSDRYFIEPGTDQKFRSVPEVQRYLQSKKHKSKSRTLTICNQAPAPRNPSQRKKNKSIQVLRDAIIDLANPPEKINWAFSGDERDNWSPLLEECMLPNYVKEEWAETFLFGMNGWKPRVPQVTMGNQSSTA